MIKNESGTSNLPRINLIMETQGKIVIGGPHGGRGIVIKALKKRKFFLIVCFLPCVLGRTCNLRDYFSKKIKKKGHPASNLSPRVVGFICLGDSLLLFRLKAEMPKVAMAVFSGYRGKGIFNFLLSQVAGCVTKYS